ncbi:type II toxin-antitoxin system antitoxin DNA ADP-ribosyl glycohydrolase DarG [Nocardia brasiliensis]|uniref:type II toxin-antitoxin system antitoxin DNA ADP-ribosyl glycohydrolase DarG n=1 Tax=Nocardia brasiliensis TaxID=37326 RepID=UPI0009DF1DD1|nr:macro domain-containing protein [Nocardia brasiliensis]
MVVEQASGDLLAADAEALVNTVNCVGVMGKGIALQFKRRFPSVFKEYEAACRRGDVQIGRMFVSSIEQLDGARWVINFPTKRHWRSPSKLEYIESGLDDLKRVLIEYGINTVAIPPLGAGNGGLSWAEVEPLIRRKLSGMEGVRVLLFSPSSVQRPVVAPEHINMTWGRALVVSLIGSYVARRAIAEPWEDQHGASHLEIQKLMYFAELLEPRLKLDFSQGRYGPYSERVRHLLQGMEGAYVTGLGDGACRVLDLSPIAPTERGYSEAKMFLANGDYDQVYSVIDRVMSWIEGFEGPYGVELLASADWVARHHRASDATKAAEVVRKWTERKGRLFTDEHVASALGHLKAVGALQG